MTLLTQCFHVSASLPRADTSPILTPAFPDQAQGGAQALEDGLVLGIVLHGATSSDEIERRLGVYDAIRRNRASVIQILSNVGQDQIHLVHGELGKYMAAKDFPSELGIKS